MTAPAKAKEIGAIDATKQDTGWFAIKLMKLMSAADKAKTIPQLWLAMHDECCEREGRVVSTYKFSIAGITQYATSDPRNIQAMLATQFQDFDLGSLRRGILLPTLGDGIFVQDGPAWSHSRALLRPNFARDQVSDLDLEERHVQNLMRVLQLRSDGWTAETDIQTLFFRLTLDTATDFLFGDSISSQLTEAGLQNNQSAERRAVGKAFSRNFDTAQKYAALRFRLANFYWLYNPKEYRSCNKAIHEFIAHYVDIALEKGAKEKEVERSGDRERYVFLDELAQRTRDPAELSAQLLNILIAGRDTTSSLLSWVFHELLRHPDVFEKLRAIIVQEFGSYQSLKNLTFSGLKSCQYLQNVINETLRMWPILAGNARQTNKITSLPRGGGPDGESPIVFAPNTMIFYSVHIMQRRKDLWGEDADQFRPERFVGRKPGWEYLPFNGGPRICIGQQFALTEASYVIVRLLQRFDRIEADPERLRGPVKSNITFTNSPGDPVTLRLHEAQLSH